MFHPGYSIGANVKRQKDCFLVYPRDSTKGKTFLINTIQISDKSNPYRGSASKYGGIIIYGDEGEGEWYLEGKHCKSGYVFIMQTDTEEFEELKKEWQNEPGKVHGIIYRKAFGKSCKDQNVVGEGFGIINGEFKTTSGAFNQGDDYHDDNWEMHPDSTECVGKVIEWWKEAGDNFRKCQNHSVKSLLSSENDTEID